MTQHDSLKSPALRIGTRGSPLALAQAEEARRRLAAAHDALSAPDAIEIVVIKTTGDRILDRPLAEIGGKGLFTKELDDALADGRVDIAVHSMKDVPTWLPEGMALDCILPREDPRDALFAGDGIDSIAALPPGAVVGSASLRRQALLLLARPDLKVVSLRGNVQTRLSRLSEGTVDATLLALAGLRRLGLADRARAFLEPEEMLPAVAQGAIGIQRRADDERVAAWLDAINDPISGVRVSAERAFLARLDGSCRTPIAALALIEGEGAPEPRLWIQGLVAMPDGSRAVRGERRGPLSEATRLGDDLGQQLLAEAGPDFLAALSTVGSP